MQDAQKAFNRDNAPNQHFQTEDLYHKTDTSYRNTRTNCRETPRETGNYALSHHYSILGLDQYRKAPYSDYEIKVTLFSHNALHAFATFCVSIHMCIKVILI